MKNLIAITALLIAQLSFGQIRKNPGDFNEIKVFDRISVELVPSDENRVEVTGSRANDVEIVNNNGQLKIRMKLEKLLSGEEVNAKIYTKGIRSIDVSEGSYVGSSATIQQPALTLTAKEGAQIKLSVAVKKLNVKSVTGGNIVLSGIADQQDIVIGTGGIVSAKALKTTHTSVGISAGGEAEVNATDLVDANIKAGGNITIYGDPKLVNEKTTLGGSIKRATD